ncbi:MAG: hypothetical protein J5J06_18485 [Phycisphaerae bacterium]|nr:hypothetical protein [Phycisphaerae bacterium]
MPSADAELTQAAAMHRAAALSGVSSTADVLDRLGEPALKTDDQFFYPGFGGGLRIDFKNGFFHTAEWEDAPHNATDLVVQRWIGIALAAVAVGLLIRHVLASALKSRTTDETTSATADT